MRQATCHEISATSQLFRERSSHSVVRLNCSAGQNESPSDVGGQEEVAANTEG